MKDRERRIRLYSLVGSEFRDADLSIYRYHVIGLAAYKATCGQGDVEHRWSYLCESAQGEPVLITEVYDLSWWEPGGPNGTNVSRQSLYAILEEPLSKAEFAHCRDIAKSLDLSDVALPLTLNLPPCSLMLSDRF